MKDAGRRARARAHRWLDRPRRRRGGRVGRRSEVVARGPPRRASTPSTPMEACDLVVLATPLAHLHDDLPGVLRRRPGGATVTDVASVKGPVLAAAAGHPSFVSGHPMAGTERSGWGASSAGLFVDAPWLVLVADGADVATGQRRVPARPHRRRPAGADPPGQPRPGPRHGVAPAPRARRRPHAAGRDPPADGGRVDARRRPRRRRRPGPADGDGRAQPRVGGGRPRPPDPHARAVPGRRRPVPLVRERPGGVGPVHRALDGAGRAAADPHRPPGRGRGRRPRHRHRRRHLHRRGARHDGFRPAAVSV